MRHSIVIGLCAVVITLSLGAIALGAVVLVHEVATPVNPDHHLDCPRIFCVRQETGE
ncbi:MAG: hypothetical protein OXH70_17400 [Acidobacteria bacterium]|nr:hypothetical protein [Acidobacteriota bacterium]